MCEVRATARSCSTGLSRTGTAPHSRARASTSSTASGSDVSCGVTAHGRPSKSAALAASGPERSLPAMGCPPTYRSTPGTSATAASGPDFTLPTSVTTASDAAQRLGDHVAQVVRRDRHHDELRPVRVGARPAGTHARRGADVVGRLVTEQHLEPGPARGQTHRGPEEAGADHLDRASESSAGLTHRAPLGPG